MGNAVAVEKAEAKRDARTEYVDKFREEYAVAIEAARVSEEHTATAGWQELYGNFRRGQRENRRGIAERLKELAGQLERANLGEEGEKALGDAKKEVAALRAADEVFDLFTVAPVRQPVSDANRIIADAKRAAEVAEESKPLIYRGVIMDIDDAAKKSMHATWDPDTGRVIVK